MKFADVDENGNPIPLEENVDVNENGIDDKVESDVYKKKHSHKLTLDWYWSIVTTLLITYLCIKFF